MNKTSDQQRLPVSCCPYKCLVFVIPPLSPPYRYICNENWGIPPLLPAHFNTCIHSFPLWLSPHIISLLPSPRSCLPLRSLFLPYLPGLHLVSPWVFYADSCLHSLTGSHVAAETVRSSSIHLCQTTLVPQGACTHAHTTHTLPWSALPWGVERPWQQATPKLANEYRSPRYSQQLGPWESQRPSGSLSTQNESGLLYIDVQIIKKTTTVLRPPVLPTVILVRITLFW